MHTENMLQHIENCRTRYFQLREEERDLDFYTDIQPACEQAFIQIEVWFNEMTQWVEQNRPRHIHLPQLKHTKEALDQITVQSYHRKTSRAMFLKSIQSIEYTLKTILEEAMNV